MFYNIVRNRNRFNKMIHFGTGAEYDKRFPIIKVKEDDFDKKIPVDDYGFGKYLCSKYIENTENIVCLRLFGLFGEGEDYRYRFISNAIYDTVNNKPITINRDVYFDYVYIKDFVKIVDWFINNKPKYKFYNIGTGKTINLVTIATKINKKISIKKKGLNNEYSCDNSRLMKELGDFKFTDIDTSIKELYESFSNRRIKGNR